MVIHKHSMDFNVVSVRDGPVKGKALLGHSQGGGGDEGHCY